MLKNDSDLNKCVSRLNSIINEINQKGYKIPNFDKKNMELNLGITDMDKAAFKADDSKMVITVNYSLMNQ